MMMSIRTGNAISITFIAVAIILSNLSRYLENPFRLIVLITCWFLMLYFTHCLSHYIVGTLMGVKFSHYFLSKSMLSKSGIPFVSAIFSKKIFLTIKIKKKAGRKAMFFMFLAGPLSSMFSPLLVFYIAYSFDRFSAFVILLIIILNAIFTGYNSYRYGCIRKAMDSLKS